MNTEGQARAGNKESLAPPGVMLFLWASMWPGAGQFAQRRIVPGLVYSLAFLVCVVLTVMDFIKVMVVYWSMADFMTDAAGVNVASTRVAAVRMVIWFLLGVTIFIVSLVDVYVVQARLRRKALDDKQAQLIRTTPPPVP